MLHNDGNTEHKIKVYFQLKVGTEKKQAYSVYSARYKWSNNLYILRLLKLWLLHDIKCSPLANCWTLLNSLKDKAGDTLYSSYCQENTKNQHCPSSCVPSE